MIRMALLDKPAVAHFFVFTHDTNAMNDATQIHWARFTELVRSHDRFLLTSHIRPDCDALGSELGMAGVLESLGKHVLVVNAQETPPNLRFIDPGHHLKTLGVDVQLHDLDTVEVLMVLDTSAWAQLGTMAEVVRATKAHKLILDHHVGEDDMGAELFKNPQAEATGRLVLEAAHHLGVRITPQMAKPLFAAIATDTGWFRFGSTSPATLRFAAELVDAGAVPSEIFAELYEQDSLPRLQLRGRILARTKTELDGRLAYTAAMREDFAATGALASDTEDVINMTLAIAGTEVAVIFVEQPTGGFKLSFRSRTARVDCNEVARTFGGGGHKAAAGAFINAPWEAAQAKVLDVVRDAMR
jgi:phosphoesterase RecJ-like protein